MTFRTSFAIASSPTLGRFDKRRTKNSSRPHAPGDALTFVEGLDRTDFLKDKRTQQAVVMSLIIIGEAAAKILDRHSSFAAARSAVPWGEMKGMRNRIAHGYYEIDLTIVWDTIEKDLPDLLASLETIDRSDT